MIRQDDESARSQPGFAASPASVSAEPSAASLLFLHEMAAFLLRSDHSFDRQRGKSLLDVLAQRAELLAELGTANREIAKFRRIMSTPTTGA